MLILLSTGILLLVFGCHGELTAQIDMVNVSGAVTINTDTWLLKTNLSGTCGIVSIFIHEFPMMYGSSQDPCNEDLIGPSWFNVTLRDVTQSNVTRNLRYEGRSLVVKACGQQTCGNLHSSNGSQQVWRAVIQSFIIGHVYFLQPSGLQPITAVVELALLEGTASFNATLFFSNLCQMNNSHILGSTEVGTTQNFIKRRVELSAVEVMSFLVLKYQDRWACTEVRAIQPKEARAQFSMKGVNGFFSFRQDSLFHPTQLTISLWRLQGLANQYRIHTLPVLADQQTGVNLCGDENTGQLWNPLAVNSTGAMSSHCGWPIGDLSGRHGTLQGHDNFTAGLTDCNLPLFGNNSIIGRSATILKVNGEPLACSTIRLEGEVITALASFHKGVVGQIMFQQAQKDPYNDVSIYIELSHVSDNISRNHNWHIHEFALSSEIESCTNAGNHFNPFSVLIGANYSQDCKPSNPLQCEAGDYAGKHGPITLSAPIPARYLFTDSSTSLDGAKSIIGLSVVIHGPERAGRRVACANIRFQPIHKGSSSFWFGSGNASAELKASQISKFDPTQININCYGLKSLAGGFHIHKLPVTEGSENPCSDNQIQGHFNPFHVDFSKSPAAGNGTDDEYEVGDISGRHGSLRNMDLMLTQFKDMNFPLSGPLSVLGRSLVIHYSNGSRMQCSTFLRNSSPGGEWLRATAEFSGNISGRIILSQIVYPGGGTSDTTIMVDLQTVPVNQNINLSWTIRTDSHGGETYNPYEIPNQGGNWSWCGSQNLQHCRVGDLTGKHGMISTGNRVLLTDTNLPLAGDLTVVRRTLALSWSTMERSSLLRPDVPITAVQFKKVASFNSSAFCDAVSRKLSVPAWKVMVLPRNETETGPCQQVEFFVIGFNDSSALTALQSQDNLGPFCTSKACCPGSLPPGSSSPPHSGALFMVVLSLLLACLGVE